jgi:hypothetical protein
MPELPSSKPVKGIRVKDYGLEIETAMDICETLDSIETTQPRGKFDEKEASQAEIEREDVIPANSIAKMTKQELNALILLTIQNNTPTDQEIVKRIVFTFDELMRRNKSSKKVQMTCTGTQTESFDIEDSQTESFDIEEKAEILDTHGCSEKDSDRPEPLEVPIEPSLDEKEMDKEILDIQTEAIFKSPPLILSPPVIEKNTFISVHYSFPQFFLAKFRNTFCHIVETTKEGVDIYNLDLVSRNVRGGGDAALEQNTISILHFMSNYFSLKNTRVCPDFYSNDVRAKIVHCDNDVNKFWYGTTSYLFKDFYGMAAWKPHTEFNGYCVYVKTSPFKTKFTTNGMPLAIYDKIIQRIIGNDVVSTKGAALLNRVIAQSTSQYHENSSWVAHYLRTEGHNLRDMCCSTAKKLPTNKSMSKVDKLLNRKNSCWDSFRTWITRPTSRQKFKKDKKSFMLPVGKSIAEIPVEKQQHIPVKESFKVVKKVIVDEPKSRPIYALYPYLSSNWLLHECSGQNILYALTARQGRAAPKVDPEIMSDFKNFCATVFTPKLPYLDEVISVEAWAQSHDNWPASKRKRFVELDKTMVREKYMHLYDEMRHRSAFVKKELINKVDPSSPPRIITNPKKSLWPLGQRLNH